MTKQQVGLDIQFQLAYLCIIDSFIHISQNLLFMPNGICVVATISGNEISFTNPFNNQVIDIDLIDFDIIYKVMSSESGSIRVNEYFYSKYPQMSIGNTVLVNPINVYKRDERFNVYFGNVIAELLQRKEQNKRPKALKEYKLFMVQYRTNYTSEYSTRMFNYYTAAQDFFLQSKAEMIEDARSHSEYEILEDDNTELCIEYDDRCQRISIEGIDLSDDDDETKRSFFKS